MQMQLRKHWTTGTLAALAMTALLGCAALTPAPPQGPVAPPAATPAWAAAAAPLAPSTLAWQPIQRGLRYATASPWPESRAHLVQLDLKEPSLRLRLSEHRHRGQPMPAQIDVMMAGLTDISMGPQALGAVVAVALNASFFDRRYAPRGHTTSEGQAWPEVLAPLESPLLACNRLQLCRIHFMPGPAADSNWFTAVAGTPWLLRGGQPRQAIDDQGCAALCARAHPRTAVGLDASGSVLTLVLVEGRRGAILGVALAPLAQWLQSLGVFDAVNLDGGGSSTLWLQGQAVMGRPDNEAAERALANALFIVRVPLDGAP